MAAAPRHLGANISAKTGKAKQSDNKCSMKGALALHAKDRLQRTLMNCIFGAEGLDEEDPFMDCLRMPSVTGQLHVPMPKVKDVEVQDWFKGEVWRLLGWEILSKEGHWPSRFLVLEQQRLESVTPVERQLAAAAACPR
ncbi:hypothetical protein LTR33_013574 [Friedmanniomyces endolithicus]|nr:hypothetical protein LTR33_013574 [Friedmanniomyces endolithicus]